MEEVYNKGLFHRWVPGPGMLGLIVLFLAVVLFINPIFAGNISLMTSSSGIMSEYFMWGNFVTIIGMSLVLPFILRIKMRFRSKELMITALVVMAIMTVVIAETTIGEVVVVACLIFGVAKMIGLVEMILPVRGILSSDGNNGRFYAVLYPITLSSSQLGIFVTSKLSLDIGWQAIHYYSAGILLMAALMCVIFMHNQRFSKKMPFIHIDWLGLFLFGTALMSMAYIFSFGTQQDWFNSPYIIWAVMIAVASIVVLIIRQLRIKHPFLSFKLYRIGSVRSGILLLVAQGMFMGVSIVMSIYTSAILGYNWLINAELNLMTLPGILLAGFVAFHWNKNQIPLKMYIFSGFASYLLYAVMLYFMMVPEMNIGQMYLPQIFNGYGMCALFIAVWIHTFDKVPQSTMLPSVAPIMIFRSFIMMAFFTSLFGWLQYKFQWQNIGDSAIYFDSLMMAHNPGLGSIRDVQLGAILASNKKLLGYVIIAGLGVLTFLFFYQFGRQKYRLVRYRAYRSEKREQIKLSGDIAGYAGGIPFPDN